MKTIRALLFVALAAPSASCATLVSSSEYEIRVESPTPGATVSAYYRKNSGAFHTGPAPAAFTLDFGQLTLAENAAYLEVAAPGYITRKLALLKTIDWWIAGNIWFWPLGLVDVGTGAMWKPQQTDFVIELERAR
jgi:hypothetical protein